MIKALGLWWMQDNTQGPTVLILNPDLATDAVLILNPDLATDAASRAAHPPTWRSTRRRGR